MLLPILLTCACSNANRKMQQSTIDRKEHITVTDKAKVIVTTEIDTTIVIPADSAQVSIPVGAGSKDSILTGRVVKNGLDLLAVYNKNTQTFTATAHVSAQSIPLKATQTTTTTSEAVMVQQLDSSEKSKKQQVNRQGVLLWPVAILLVLLAAIYFLWRWCRFIK
ncbi:hypothetical protein [Chitinophaga hostae]